MIYGYKTKYVFLFSNNIETRDIPRLRGWWNVTADEYRQMGYTPGLPPGIYAPHTPEIQRLSNVFEAAGLTDEYPESPISTLYTKKTVVVYNAPPDVPLITVASYITESMISRGLLSNPENKPLIHTFPETLSFTMTFKNRKDALSVLSLSDEISFHGNPLNIGPFQRETDMPIPPINIQSHH